MSRRKLKGESKVLPPLKKIINLCVRVKKNKRDFFFSRETYTKIIVNDLINSELIRSLFRSFSLQRERFFHVNICVFVCDCYFELLVFVIILFRTQQQLVIHLTFRVFSVICEVAINFARISL